MTRQVRNRSRIAGLFLPVMLAPAFADDIQVSSTIDSVSVFLAGAEVTRTGSVQIPTGEHQLIIADLPARIDPARMQLRISNDNVRLGNLQLEEIHEGDLTSAEEQRLQAELEELLYNRQQVADEIESANTQLKLLDSLASGAVGSDQATLSGNELTALLETLVTSSNQSRQVIRDANRSLQVIDRDIEQKRFELSQVATRQRSQQVLTVAVAASESGDAMISVSYPVARARWNWLYEARLDTGSRNLELQRKVSVTQTTGEDWDNVQLTISTARPNENTETPQLGSLLVDFFRPEPLRMESRTLSSPAAADLTLAGELEEIAVTGAYLRNAANVVASQYIVNFEIPGRVNVAADSQPQIVPIDQRGIPVELVTRAVPERDDNAYLEARFTLEDSVPLQAGPMQLYRDGSFIGRRMVADFLPGEEVSLPFGRDDRVRVETRAEPQESRDGGTFRRNAVDDRRVRYELTSFHDQPIELEILARIPIAQNDAIEVEFSDEATPFDEDNVDGNTGVILWRRQAQPAQMIEIKHFYGISYPQDNQLWFRDN